MKAFVGERFAFVTTDRLSALLFGVAVRPSRHVMWRRNTINFSAHGLCIVEHCEATGTHNGKGAVP
jgi:hypothetical protein